MHTRYIARAQRRREGKNRGYVSTSFSIAVFNNIINDYALRGFFRVQIHFWNANVSKFTVYFIKARSSLILSCSSGSFSIYIYTLFVGVIEGKKRIVGGGGGKSVSPFKPGE